MDDADRSRRGLSAEECRWKMIGKRNKRGKRPKATRSSTGTPANLLFTVIRIENGVGGSGDAIKLPED